MTGRVSGEAFLTQPGAFSAMIADAIRAETGIAPELSTTGGTSDGRFIADICPEVIEFGPTNATIHKLNERIALDELERLPGVYREMLVNLLAK